MSVAAPSYDADFYSDEFIRNPWPHYERMRALGPVVWMPRHENYALTRYDALEAALRDHETFISGKGIAADAKGNELTLGIRNGAASDGERHALIRSLTAEPLLPRALEEVRGKIEAAASELVDEFAGQGEFDLMEKFASYMPLSIVTKLVGFPDFGRENMLRWASAAFDLVGVQNARGRAAIDVFAEMRQFLMNEISPEDLIPGSWSRRVFDLVEQGKLPPEDTLVAIRNYVTPSLETTISAIGQLVYRLGTNPDQWVLLKRKPELVRGAVNEAMRIGTPARSLARHTSRAVDVEGITIPENARVMMVFACANHDERVFPDPGKFDITRPPRRHLSFGRGIHMCIGMHLAELEMSVLLGAILARVREIRVGEPTVILNNTLYSFATLPTQFIA
ncbi:cytochrome P450 [Burkholderia ubonensis]|uniref:Cytochrome P450 n=1 Tax=Burkholderia ubonensis subsp. mesacidophila TaxID=265293 RepID=A0A2A4FMX8_9BURK|nr:cytochrome P450 [Burkholderia ubonensis]PCE33699.1 hypothetical protein BZL54_04125 [Burkholderia ubonensis subsp. mesacidophila]